MYTTYQHINQLQDGKYCFAGQDSVSVVERLKTYENIWTTLIGVSNTSLPHCPSGNNDNSGGELSGNNDRQGRTRMLQVGIVMFELILATIDTMSVMITQVGIVKKRELCQSGH